MLTTDLQQIRGNKLYRSSADKFESLPATSRLTKWNTRRGERRTCKSSSVAVEAMHHQADWFDTPEFVVAEEWKETPSWWVTYICKAYVYIFCL